jgi:multiple sugar transport system substrate-binding protein
VSGAVARRSALALLGGAALSACAGRDHDPSSLEVWVMGPEADAAAVLAAAFEIAEPGVRIHVQQLPWTAAHAKLLTAYAGGALPDVCEVGNTWLAEFVALGAVERLDRRVEASASIRPSDYFPGVWRTNIVSHGLWGLPWYVDTRLLFYRRDLAERAGAGAPPSDWAGWLKAMRSIRDQAPAGDWATLMPLNEYEPLLALALQQPDPLLRDGGTFGNFRSPGFRRALAFYGEIFRQGLAPLATNTEVSSLYEEFARGRYASVLTGPWNLGEFARRLPAELQPAWATTPLPGPDGPGAGIAGGSSLVVTARSPRKDLAWRFVEHLSQPRVQSRFHAMTGDLPARRSAWDLGDLAQDATAAAFRDQLARVRPAPAVPEWERIATEMQAVAEAMVRGRLTLDAAVTEMDRRADRLLEKRRWLAERAAETGA